VLVLVLVLVLVPVGETAALRLLTSS